MWGEVGAAFNLLAAAAATTTAFVAAATAEAEELFHSSSTPGKHTYALIGARHSPGSCSRSRCGNRKPSRGDTSLFPRASITPFAGTPIRDPDPSGDQSLDRNNKASKELIMEVRHFPTIYIELIHGHMVFCVVY